MDFPKCKKCLEQAGLGKRLPSPLYVCRDANTRLLEPLDSLLEMLVERCEIPPEFNESKLRTDELMVSVLLYPDFLSDAHPGLEACDHGWLAPRFPWFRPYGPARANAAATRLARCRPTLAPHRRFRVQPLH